mmetsp:Transcript_71764/g.168947  ORF Transcript_71764/g.168947 Transcript_71764/m.168947 type:complete len:204 (+) Transcript_71764:44-655(+)
MSSKLQPAVVVNPASAHGPEFSSPRTPKMRRAEAAENSPLSQDGPTPKRPRKFSAEASVCFVNPATGQMLTGNRAPRRKETINKYLAEGWLPLDPTRKKRTSSSSRPAVSPTKTIVNGSPPVPPPFEMHQGDSVSDWSVFTMAKSTFFARADQGSEIDSDDTATTLDAWAVEERSDSWSPTPLEDVENTPSFDVDAFLNLDDL